MKKCILMMCLLFVTGCSVTYNLDVDKLTEKTIFTENNFSEVDEEDSSNLLYSVDDYLIRPLPISKDVLTPSEIYERVEGVKYYDVENASDENRTGLIISGTFDNISEFSESNVAWYGCNLDVRNDSKGVVIEASNFKNFDVVNDLDIITINLKSKHKVTNNNADSVDGDIYTWVINRGNYRDKTIYFSYSTNNLLNSDNYKNNPLFTFSICIFVIIFVFVIIYFVLKRRYDSRNSL